MHNLRKSMRLEECSRSGAVGDIDPLEAESLFTLECPDPRLFKSGIVVWRHVVDADHAASRREQSPSHMRADESGGASHQNGFVGHGRWILENGVGFSRAALSGSTFGESSYDDTPISAGTN